MSEDWRSSAGTPGTILSIMQIVKKPICHQARGVDPMLGAGATVELRGDLTHPLHLARRCVISLMICNHDQNVAIVTIIATFLHG